MKYIFRGVVVFEYNPDTQQITMPHDENCYGNFNHCIWITEDYKLLGYFFNRAYQHAAGLDDCLDDIVVN